MTAERRSLPVLNSRFRNRETFRRGATSYRLLPFRFLALDERRVALSNIAGELSIVPRDKVAQIIEHRLELDDPLYEELVAKHFVQDAADHSAVDLLAVQLRTKYAFLDQFTSLHLFVVTLRCDHSCPYCQVSRVSSDRSAYDMTRETADKAIELSLASPSRSLKIEFQGGEPLLNFEMIRYIVERVSERIAGTDRNVVFVVATNLAAITDSMLEFFRTFKVQISTSLDGPAELHNANRPRPGNNSYELAVEGIGRCRDALGAEAVSALMTTTLRSLDQPEAIVDEYCRQGFASLFLRWLSPYGFAAKTGRAIGYPVEAWNRFYARGLDYILRLNRAGTPFREDYASIVLQKMLTPFPTRYVDLQSPSGLGMAVAVYNYDGDVYASDEGRMLAETGDRTFRLGNVHADSYADLFGSQKLMDMLDRTMTEAIPMCEQCAFEPYCGTDPTFHHATQGDMVGSRPTSAFCARNMFVIRHLIRLLHDDELAQPVLEEWAR